VRKRVLQQQTIVRFRVKICHSYTDYFRTHGRDGQNTKNKQETDMSIHDSSMTIRCDQPQYAADDIV